MSNRLTTDQINAIAEANGFEPRAVRALLQVETGGRGYDKETGYLLIQFEPSWFRRLLPKPIQTELEQARRAKTAGTLTPKQSALLADWDITQDNKVEGQVRERIAFNAATRISSRTAQLSTSWGLPQLMGFNHTAAGFTSVEGMVEAFRQSEANQLTAMLRWIRSKKVLHFGLLRHEWGVVAYNYNGPAYKNNNYDKKLEAAYNALA